MKIKQLTSIIILLKNNILFVAGIFGIIFAIFFSFSRGKLPEIPANQICLPATSPFENTISGIGFVEASSRNIQVGSYTSGIVDKVFVKPGDVVQMNDPLLQIDSRVAKTNLQIAEAEVEVLTHNVTALEAAFSMAQDQYSRDKQLKKGVKSELELKRSLLEYEKAKAELLMQRQRLHQAKKKVALSHIVLDQNVIKAPVSGMIFKTYVHGGEYIKEVSQTPIILMGTHTPLHVRVQIDENDMWRFVNGAKAQAVLRGNTQLKYPLTFIRTEPLAASKKQLSGASDERVDTRVIEIVYRIDNADSIPNVQLLSGQILDIFIEARCAA